MLFLGVNGSFERSRYLSLYNSKSWKKVIKSGEVSLQRPRFELLAYTQPMNLMKFARTNNHDGFFQRFIATCPKEVYILYEEKEKEFTNSGMLETLSLLYDLSYLIMHSIFFNYQPFY